MNEQVVKIEYDGNEVYFFEYDFKSGYEHSEEFIERNKGEIKMKVYHVNNSPYGDRWRYVKSV